MNGAIFVRVAVYGFERKIKVVAAYHHHVEESGPLIVSKSAVAQECQVSRTFVDKVVT